MMAIRIPRQLRNRGLLNEKPYGLTKVRFLHHLVVMRITEQKKAAYPAGIAAMGERIGLRANSEQRRVVTRLSTITSP